MKDAWVHTAIVIVLRAGVILSVAVMAIGMPMTFLHHPEYFSSRPALGALTEANAHFPNTLSEIVSGVRQMKGQAIVMAGLLILIATPVARVALSVILFLVARDRWYALITSAVLVILLVSFMVGLVGG